jgi:hypothetical protein
MLLCSAKHRLLLSSSKVAEQEIHAVKLIMHMLTCIICSMPGQESDEFSILLLEYQLLWAGNPSGNSFKSFTILIILQLKLKLLVSAGRQHSYHDRDIYRGLMSTCCGQAIQSILCCASITTTIHVISLPALPGVTFE